MTGAQLNSLINQKCGTNDTTFALADKLVLVNVFKDEIASRIEQQDANYFLIPSTFNLVANQREYPIGDDVMNRIKKLELKFVATNSRFTSRYIKDYLGSEDEAEIVLNYSNDRNNFAHTIRRRALFILSGTIANTTAGGKVWASIFPSDLANLTGVTGLEVDPTTTSFGFPRQFHELLARRVAMEWKGLQPKPLPLNTYELNYEVDLQKGLDALWPMDGSGEIVAESPGREDTWDNGFNL